MGTRLVGDKSWYNIKAVPKNNATSDVEISIYDEIGIWGIDAATFKEDFDKVKNLGNIKLRINSPGGSVFDGLAIYNVLSDVRDKLTVEIDGLAASIASVIALAGGHKVMREGTLFMIHSPFTFAIGGADDLRKEAEVLDQIEDQIISIYEKNSNLNVETIKALVKAETWMNAETAKEYGFIDETVDAPRMAASFNKPMKDFGFNSLPANVFEKPKEVDVTVNDIEEKVTQNAVDTTDIQRRILKLKIDNLK